jgi:hypothetical protein
MSMYPETETDLPAIIEQIKQLAATRNHRIARQLTQLDRMSLKAALAMRSYLSRLPEFAPASRPLNIGRQVHRATTAAFTAAQLAEMANEDGDGGPACGHEAHAGAMGVPVSRAELDARLNAEAAEKDQAYQRDQRTQRAPAAERIRTEEDEGYYLHDGRMYKVATSQYGASQGHLFARKLNEQTGDWERAQGMTSYLRKSEKITLEQAIEFGRQLEITPQMALYGKCWICKRVLTDEESIANRVGPGPHKGIDC